MKHKTLFFTVLENGSNQRFERQKTGLTVMHGKSGTWDSGWELTFDFESKSIKTSVY